MLDAKSAREKSMKTNEECAAVELGAMERQIFEACKRGRTSVSVKGKLNSATVKRLEELGYVVKNTDYNGLDGTWTTISW